MFSVSPRRRLLVSPRVALLVLLHLPLSQFLFFTTLTKLVSSCNLPGSTVVTKSDLLERSVLSGRNFASGVRLKSV